MSIAVTVWYMSHFTTKNSRAFREIDVINSSIIQSICCSNFLQFFFLTCFWNTIDLSIVTARAMSNCRGALIVFEGIDRSGKTTQCKLVADFLKKRNIAVIQKRFPGINVCIWLFCWCNCPFLFFFKISWSFGSTTKKNLSNFFSLFWYLLL